MFICRSWRTKPCLGTRLCLTIIQNKIVLTTLWINICFKMSYSTRDSYSSYHSAWYLICASMWVEEIFEFWLCFRHYLKNLKLSKNTLKCSKDFWYSFGHLLLIIFFLYIYLIYIIWFVTFWYITYDLYH